MINFFTKVFLKLIPPIQIDIYKVKIIILHGTWTINLCSDQNNIELMRDLCRKIYQYSNLRYADDITLIALNFDGIKKTNSIGEF